jgi:topoisomerase-4 subunit A
LYYVKRFRIETTTVDKKFLFISDEKGSKLHFASVDVYPRIELTFKKDEKGAPLEHEEIALDEVAEIRGWKALGSKLSTHKVQAIKPLDPKIVEVSVPESIGDEDKTEANDVIVSKLVEPEEIEFPENSDSEVRTIRIILILLHLLKI